MFSLTVFRFFTALEYYANIVFIRSFFSFHFFFSSFLFLISNIYYSSFFVRWIFVCFTFRTLQLSCSHHVDDVTLNELNSNFKNAIKIEDDFAKKTDILSIISCRIFVRFFFFFSNIRFFRLMTIQLNASWMNSSVSLYGLLGYFLASALWSNRLREEEKQNTRNSGKIFQL